MVGFYQNQQWLLIALVFFGIIAYIAWIRWRDRKWINERFGNQNLRFLLLLPDSLFYRSRMKKIELEIPGSRIAQVYHDRTHKGVDLHVSLVKIDFIDSENQRDTAAFKVPYPPQWIQAIENTLIKKR